MRFFGVSAVWGRDASRTGASGRGALFQTRPFFKPGPSGAYKGNPNPRTCKIFDLFFLPGAGFRALRRLRSPKVRFPGGFGKGNAVSAENFSYLCPARFLHRAAPGRWNGNPVRIRNSTCCCEFPSPHSEKRRLPHSLPLASGREGAAGGTSQKTGLAAFCGFAPAGLRQKSYRLISIHSVGFPNVPRERSEAARPRTARTIPSGIGPCGAET